MTSKKTDNHDPAGKLALRRHFMARYHSDGQAKVCDCRMGSGFLWRELRNTIQVKSYLGLDVKPMKGRLKIDSVRYLQAGGWNHDVIDIDTYGAPWKHWFAMLDHVGWSCTVFLTIGMVKICGGGNIPTVCKEHIGIQGMKHIPMSIIGRLDQYVTDTCLAAPLRMGFRVSECLEATSHGKARYIGIRLEKT